MKRHEFKTVEERILYYKGIMPQEYCTEEFIKKLLNLGFFVAPASIRFHGNYTGGLFEHSLEVTRSLYWMTRKDCGNIFAERYVPEWERLESPYIVGMFHDLCKCTDYVIKNGKWQYNKNTEPGHGERSVKMIKEILGIKLTEEEEQCILWHMGAYSTDTRQWQELGKAIEKYPNVLYTHTADMVASKVVGI